MRFAAVSSGILTVCLLTLAAEPGLAFDGSTQSAPAKISPKSFSSAEQALRAGIDDLNAGDAASSVAALTYAAEGGQPIARWKLGEMYADGVGVARDDVKAYQYFNKLVEDYDEDAPDQRNRGAISNAFVAVGIYCLTGIPNSSVRADPERARGLFQYAASTFGDPDAQYNLAHMYITGTGGLAKDDIIALRWLMLAAAKGHRPSQALLGHMLFAGDGLAPQRARGLMWLTIAKNGAQGAKDDWIRNIYQSDFANASPEDRKAAATMLEARAKGPPLPSFISRSVVRTLQILRPLGVPILAGVSQSQPEE
jgi:exopolysaccharide production negative regulator